MPNYSSPTQAQLALVDGDDLHAPDPRLVHPPWCRAESHRWHDLDQAHSTAPEAVALVEHTPTDPSTVTVSVEQEVHRDDPDGPWLPSEPSVMLQVRSGGRGSVQVSVDDWRRLRAAVDRHFALLGLVA